MANLKIDTSLEIEVAKRLKIFRQTLKLSQPKVAERIGKDFTTVGRMETGRLAITIDIVQLYHTVFGMNLKWFYTGKGDPIEAPEDKKRSTITSDISTLRTNDEILKLEVENLKKELYKLHAYVHEKKHSIQKRDTVGTINN